MNLSIYIRWMIRRDLPTVLSIENACFEFPWSRDDYLRTLQNRGVIAMVAEVNHAVAGFMLYELHTNSMDLLNFAVDPVYHRHGIGNAMAANLIGKLNAKRRWLSLEVRESNLPAQLFFQSHGFKATAIRRNQYEDSAEDAYVMQRKYRESAEIHHTLTRKADAF